MENHAKTDCDAGTSIDKDVADTEMDDNIDTTTVVEENKDVSRNKNTFEGCQMDEKENQDNEKIAAAETEENEAEAEAEIENKENKETEENEEEVTSVESAE